MAIGPGAFGFADFRFPFNSPDGETGAGPFVYDIYDDEMTELDFDLQLSIVDEGTGTGNTSGGNAFDATSGDRVGGSFRIRLDDAPVHDPYVIFNLQFLDGTTGTPVAINDLNIQFFDVDSNPGNDFADVVGYGSGLNPNAILADNTSLVRIPPGGTENGFPAFVNTGASDPINTGFTTFRLPEADFESADNFANDDFANQQTVTTSLFFDEFPAVGGDFIFGITGSSTIAKPGRNFFVNMSDPPYVSTVIPEPAVVGGGFGLAALLMARRRRLSH
ncbi:MAG: hypothetical protein ACFB21_14540 [Opitutales bacterium]